MELDRGTEEEAVDVEALRERLQQVGWVRQLASWNGMGWHVGCGACGRALHGRVGSHRTGLEAEQAPAACCARCRFRAVPYWVESSYALTNKLLPTVILIMQGGLEGTRLPPPLRRSQPHLHSLGRAASEGPEPAVSPGAVLESEPVTPAVPRAVSLESGGGVAGEGVMLEVGAGGRLGFEVGFGGARSHHHSVHKAGGMLEARGRLGGLARERRSAGMQAMQLFALCNSARGGCCGAGVRLDARPQQTPGQERCSFPSHRQLVLATFRNAGTHQACWGAWDLTARKARHQPAIADNGTSAAMAGNWSAVSSVLCSSCAVAWLRIGPSQPGRSCGPDCWESASGPSG